MSYPKDFLYTKEHEWVRIEGNIATVGITSYAVEQLGDVVHLELPKAGEIFAAHATFGAVESTKTVSDLYTPIAGKVQAVNSALTETPERLAEDPHGQCWLIKMETQGSVSGLLSAAEYETYIKDSH